MLLLVMSTILKPAGRASERSWRLGRPLSAILACLLLAAAGATLVEGGQAWASQQPSSGGPSQSTPGSGGGPAPGVSATVEACLTGVDASARSATFSGQMTAVTGTARMTMRIDVQERAPGDVLFHTINAPGLGVWRRSSGGVTIYKYLKQVTNLPAPAVFRAVVHFRWLGDQGRLLKRAERRTAVCEEPEAAVGDTPAAPPAATG